MFYKQKINENINTCLELKETLRSIYIAGFNADGCELSLRIVVSTSANAEITQISTTLSVKMFEKLPFALPYT